MQVKIKLFKANKDEPGTEEIVIDDATDVGVTNTGFLKVQTADLEHCYPLQLIYSYHSERKRVATIEAAK